jgi:hypothetical protein
LKFIKKKLFSEQLSVCYSFKQNFINNYKKNSIAKIHVYRLDNFKY